MAYQERTEFVKQLGGLLDQVQSYSFALMNDYRISLDGTDSNFPNKIDKLNDQIRGCQYLIDSIDEVLINLSNIEP